MSTTADGKLWQPLKFWAAASLAEYNGYLMTHSSKVKCVLYTNNKMVLPTQQIFQMYFARSVW
jgi:hypothetical protein